MRCHHPTRSRGFALVDLAVCLLGIFLLLVIALPILGTARTTSGVQQSMSNLTQIGMAHATYVMDHYDRQLTFVVDDIASYGDSAESAFPEYRQEHYYDHPNMLAGWGLDNGGSGPVLYSYFLDGLIP